jgi:hypothetical protein
MSRGMIGPSLHHVEIGVPQGAPMALWLSRPPIHGRQAGSIPGHIGLIIRGSLRPSNGAVNRDSLYLVSAEAINPQLCTCPSANKQNFGPISFLVWPPKGQRESAISPELMTGSSQNIYHGYI